jgi:hypothetical protein
MELAEADLSPPQGAVVGGARQAERGGAEVMDANHFAAADIVCVQCCNLVTPDYPKDPLNDGIAPDNRVHCDPPLRT